VEREKVVTMRCSSSITIESCAITAKAVRKWVDATQRKDCGNRGGGELAV